MSAGNSGGVASKDYLKRIAEGSGNVDPSGNFSIEVLRSALINGFDLTLANTLQEKVRYIRTSRTPGIIKCDENAHNSNISSFSRIGARDGDNQL